jgi:nitroreductase
MNDSRLYDDLLTLAKERRTIRRFRSDPIPEGSISKIIDVARWAPSGFHTQPWEFVVITEKEVRDKIVRILRQYGPPIENPSPDAPTPSTGRFDVAPVFILVLGDWRARVGLPDQVQSSEERVNNTIRTSLSCAFFAMQLAATALGLASQWYSATSGEKAQSAIKELIGIPKDLKIFDMMVLGYGAEEPLPKDVRNMDAMVHYNNCGTEDFRTDEQVNSDAMKTKAWCFAAH